MPATTSNQAQSDNPPFPAEETIPAEHASHQPLINLIETQTEDSVIEIETGLPAVQPEVRLQGEPAVGSGAEGEEDQSEEAGGVVSGWQWEEVWEDL